MKSREEILAKVDEIVSATDADDEDFEFSVEGEVKALLVAIAGDCQATMLSEAKAEELLHVKDIYHYQWDAVRRVRKFLSEE
jgi:hypothetical protein